MKHEPKDAELSGFRPEVLVEILVFCACAQPKTSVGTCRQISSILHEIELYVYDDGVRFQTDSKCLAASGELRWRFPVQVFFWGGDASPCLP